jgi:hypothetical protein
MGPVRDSADARQLPNGNWSPSLLSEMVLANSSCQGTCCAILDSMRSRASRITAVVVLLTCLICPLLELFDSWDDTIQTGNDTEYALVVLALCVGVAYSFARFISKSELLGSVAKSIFASCTQNSFLSAQCSFFLLLFDATSPPALPLRL